MTEYRDLVRSLFTWGRDVLAVAGVLFTYLFIQYDPIPWSCIQYPINYFCGIAWPESRMIEIAISSVVVVLLVRLALRLRSRWSMEVVKDVTS